MNEAWEVFNLITSTYYGKAMYFAENGERNIIYSRYSGKYFSFDDAVVEFCELIGE